MISVYTKSKPRGSVNFRPGSNPDQERTNLMAEADSVHSTPPEKNVCSTRKQSTGVTSSKRLAIELSQQQLSPVRYF